MFKIHIGKTPNKLNDKDFEYMATKTEGFSGSDISGIVQDALMEPVRTMQQATHFKKIPDPKGEMDYIIVPCSSGDKKGKKMKLMEIPDKDQDKVRAEDLKLAHFMRVIKNVKPSVGQADIKRHIDWTEEFGQEG